jgi:hypothetical protein
VIQDVSIDAAYYEWVVDGAHVVHRAAPDQDDVDLPRIAYSPGQPLLIEIGSSALPADYVVESFHELDGQGLPVEGFGQVVDCLSPVSTCSMTARGDTITASVRLATPPQIVVVHLVYADATAADEVSHLTGSWGARIVGDVGVDPP